MVSHLAPSFPCPTPRDPLGQLICESPSLSRSDLAFVQTYQALRQQSSPDQQVALRNDAARFGRAVRTACGIGQPVGPNEPVPENPPPKAAACVAREYAQQRAAWAARLQGAAAEEAKRSLTQQIALQKDLQIIGLLPNNEPANGVYGNATRAAIMAFQQTMGLSATGLMGDEMAGALMHEADSQSGHPHAPTTTPTRSAWDDFQGDAAAMGVKVNASLADACMVAFQIRNPDALADATRESVHASGGPAVNATDLFAAEMNFLQTHFAARAVHAFYAAQPDSVDRCGFTATAFTVDLYGRDIAQPLFAFQFDRATYAKIIWARFDPTNMPKIMLAFEYGTYANQRLGLAKPKPEPSVTMPASAPAAPKTQQVSATPEPPTASKQMDAPIARWSGTSTMITRPFHVDGAWELQWTSDGPFKAILHQLSPESAKPVAHANGAAASSAFEPTGGDYYLEIASTDRWSAVVVRVSQASGDKLAGP